MKTIDFNVNEYVYVKLTELGKKMHYDHYKKLLTFGYSYPYKPPEEDAEGWSRFQMWEVMRLFGSAWHLGVDNFPFATKIKIEVYEG